MHDLFSCQVFGAEKAHGSDEGLMRKKERSQVDDAVKMPRQDFC